MTSIRVLILDDNLESVTTPLEKALKPFLESEQRLPAFAGRETEPIPLKVGGETLECSFSFSTSKDASAVAGQILDGKFKNEVDLVLLDSDWQNDRHAGSQKVLPAIVNADSGIVGPRGLLPFIALFTGYWKDTGEEFAMRLESVTKDRKGTEFRFDGLQKEDWVRLRLLFRTVIQARLLVEKTQKLIDLKRFDEKASIDERPLIGTSRLMKMVFTLIDKCAASHDSTVLISGESGTGKELVARALHYRSKRKHEPFVAINCGQLDEPLAESALFGHERGAFTGATTSRPGHFREADGGTILLDEIASLKPALQAKLLRVLQEKEVRPLGASANTKIDVRVIAGTNEPLEQCVKDGRFREDLFYRLNVLKIELPPLRERQEDIPALIAHFILKKASGRSIKLSDEARRLLESYHWPGNVRELENAIESACVLCDANEIKSKDLPSEICDGQTGLRPTGIQDASGQRSRDIQVTIVANPFWEGLKNNGFKLWRIVNLEDVRKQTQAALSNAFFVADSACPKGSQVQVVTVENLSQIPSQGNGVAFVAKVGKEGALHIRIFNRKGEQVVNKSETQLRQDKVQELRELLVKLGEPQRLSDANRETILNLVTVTTARSIEETPISISKKTPRLVGFIPPMPFKVAYIDPASGQSRVREVQLGSNYHPEPNYIKKLYQDGGGSTIVNQVPQMRAAVLRHMREKKLTLHQAFKQMTETVINSDLAQDKGLLKTGFENLWETESKGKNVAFGNLSNLCRCNPSQVDKMIQEHFPDYVPPLQ